MRMVDLDIRAATPREHERQLEELLKKIRISGTEAYDIYTISYNNANPRLVRDVVQSLLTIFVEGSFKGKKGDSDKAVQFIDEQIRTYEEKLLAAENTLKEFRLKNNFLLPRQGIDYAAQLQISADALNSARLELTEAEQARKSMAAQMNGDEPVVGVGAAMPPGATPELDARIAELGKALDTLRMTYTDLHPDIAATLRLIEQLKERKKEEAAKRAPDNDPGKGYSVMLQQLKIALAEADARVASIKARAQEMQARHERLLQQSNAVPEVESQLAQLNRDYQVNKDNYEALIARRESARLSGELSTTTEMMSFKVIDPPTVPLRPVGPNRALLSSAVLGVALAGGAALALVLSQARPIFLNPSELRHATGFRVVGTVAMNWTPAEKLRRRLGRIGLGAGMMGFCACYGGIMTYALV